VEDSTRKDKRAEVFLIKKRERVEACCIGQREKREIQARSAREVDTEA